MKALFAPWRYAYIKGDDAGPDAVEGCFFCAAATEPDDPERLVAHVGEHHLVMLNRHPYTNGHLMVAPLAHVGSPAEAAAAAQAELWPLTLACCEVLSGYSRPDGFNLGMNLGRSAGAGVPDHYHFHVVPRWEGDTNFMGTVAETRMIPQSLTDAWNDLRQRFGEHFATDPGGETRGD